MSTTKNPCTYTYYLRSLFIHRQNNKIIIGKKTLFHILPDNVVEKNSRQFLITIHNSFLDNTPNYPKEQIKKVPKSTFLPASV